MTSLVGPGYDVLGLALSLWLELQVSISNTRTPTKYNCTITSAGDGADKIPADPRNNLITKAALNVLRCNNKQTFPLQTHIHIVNNIPLGRGLGSSGAAIVAGVMLADSVAGLGLTKDQMLPYCLVEESHPDNIAASLFGSFVASYVQQLRSMVLGESFGKANGMPSGTDGSGVDDIASPVYPTLKASHVQYPWSSAIKIIVIIPDYEVKTESARAVLPERYRKEDVNFNLQRVALLPHLLGQVVPDCTMIYEAMQDRMHQPQRRHLVHGLERLLQLSPDKIPGLLGICLSGAGPSVLVLATHNYDEISMMVIDIIKSSSNESIHCEWKLLDPAHDGASITYPTWFGESS